MAYDEDLADRIRVLLDGEAGVVEKKMFGGLAFLIGGHLSVSASGHGGILVRCDPAETDRLTASSQAEVAIMRGRPMDGWLRVAADGIRTEEQLAAWVKLGAAYARSLPPK